MSDIIKDVLEFRLKYDLYVGEKPRLLKREELDFWTNFIREELDEFIRAHRRNNTVASPIESYHQSLVEASDAVADLIYVAIGIGHVMGLPLYEIFAAVHKANMTGKVKVTFPAESKRLYLDDVIKGPEYVAPEPAISGILRKYV